ncbi:MAG: diaminopimelate decarboxylase [Dehalococcoidia bacterium]|nr:diaminopimelate decarboxylase [Dehalococcoidia bacterium]
MTRNGKDLIPLFPMGTEVDSRGHLRIGGCDSVELAARFGTPLYVFDEGTLRARCREFRDEFTRRHPQSLVLYASKAFINKTLVSILASEGLGLDVVSGGELAVARSVKFPARNIYFHGNNKSPAELEQAVAYGIGRVVVDGFSDLALMEKVAAERGVTQDIMLRLSPGVDAHTHASITTGILDSKFGFPLQNGQAEEAVKQAICQPHLNLVGLHCHIGSQVFEVGPYLEAIQVMLQFAADMHSKHGFEMMEFSPGGGFPVQYVSGPAAPPVSAYADAMVSTLTSVCSQLKITVPRLTVEPGRAIVGRAGVALYSVGTIKEIPGVRKYVSVDGGMGDNIRPAIYDAKYEALLANRAGEAAVETVTISGRFCESGDVLIKDASLPQVATGDTVAIPVSGAYCPSMASNYNAVPRPAIVLVKDGQARVIRRRETYEDLMAMDSD